MYVTLFAITVLVLSLGLLSVLNTNTVKISSNTVISQASVPSKSTVFLFKDGFEKTDTSKNSNLDLSYCIYGSLETFGSSGVKAAESNDTLLDPKITSSSENFNEPCDISTRLNGFSISAVVANGLLLLGGIFYITCMRTSVTLFSIFLLSMVGLLVSTCGIIAEQVHLVDFFSSAEGSFDYDAAFYFSNLCLGLEVSVCAVCGWKWHKNKKNGVYADLL